MLKLPQWILAALFAVGATLPASSWAQSGADLEKQLDEARSRLDHAAAELAEAYKKAYATRSKKRSDRAMLGVLLEDCWFCDGVKLSGVTPGGGADQEGLQAGDVLLKVDDVVLEEGPRKPFDNLSHYMEKVTPGDVVVVEYERDGEQLTARITTQAHGAQSMRLLSEKVSRIGEDLGRVHTRVFAPDPPCPPGHEGITTLMDIEGDLADYFDVSSGVLVLREPTKGRVKAGDVIASIDGREVEDAEDAMHRLTRIDEPTAVSVLREGKRRAVTVEPGDFGDDHHTSMRVIRIDRSED